MKLLLNLIFLILCVQVYSQNWTGNVNSDWNNNLNWSVAPSNGDDITIDPANYTGVAASPIISSNSNFSPAQVLIANGGNLTISANLTTTDDINVIDPNSSLIITAGILNVNVNDGGRLIVELGATMMMNNGTVNIGERFIAGEDALITINDGTAASGERLLMDLGGQFIQNGGNVSTASVFAMADGNINGNSSYTLNNGNLLIVGEMAFENEAGNFEPTFTQNGGTLTLNGDMFWFGEAPGSGTPRFLMHDGISNINGIIENMPLSTVDMYFKIDGNATLNFNGTRWENIHITDSIIVLDNAIVNFSNTSNLINVGVIYSANSTLNFNGNTNVVGIGTFQFPNVKIGLTGTLTHTTTSTISVAGNFDNLNTFNPSTNQITFNGTQNQLVSSIGNLNFYNLEISNTSSGGVSIEETDPINYTVSNHLELTQGTLNVDATENFKLLNNATASSGSDLSFVNGPMSKIGMNPFIFPIGKNTKWRRLSISSPATVNSEFKAEYFDDSYTSISPVNSPITSVSNAEYWQLDQTSGSDNLSVELFWEDASMSYITNCNELSIAQWNGSSWNNILSTTSGSCVGSDAGSINSNATISSFGALTFGFYSGVTTQNFAICQGESIVVGPNTYSTSGTFVDVLQDQSLADSTVITHITVADPVASFAHNSTILEAPMNAQYSYQWMNCLGSIISTETSNTFTPGESGNYALIVTQNSCVDTSSCMYYTIIDTTICNGITYQVGTSSYTSSNTYSDLLSATDATDSLVISNLTVNSPIITTSIASITITVNANNALYQWINCADNSIITNETNQSFTPTANGSYAVEVTENGCLDTSACVLINSVGVNEMATSKINVYPNPFDSSVSVELNGIQTDKIFLFNSLGQVISEAKISNSEITFNTNDFISGVYYIQINTVNGLIVRKLIKQ